MIHINTYWLDDQLPIIFTMFPCKYNTIVIKWKKIHIDDESKTITIKYKYNKMQIWYISTLIGRMINYPSYSLCSHLCTYNTIAIKYKYTLTMNINNYNELQIQLKLQYDIQKNFLCWWSTTSFPWKYDTLLTKYKYR